MPKKSYVTDEVVKSVEARLDHLREASKERKTGRLKAPVDLFSELSTMLRRAFTDLCNGKFTDDTMEAAIAYILLIKEAVESGKPDRKE